MRILQMKASFGKLAHDSITLVPGMNILEAPNEWGKSTWCAFIVAMLYGIDTRSKSSKSQLAEKERYAPWSGAPMEGSMDLLWEDRKITIQRSTSGRIPLGEFRAFETDTGLDIPELTADNCGLMLTGVEREVFTRAGFLRLSELPVTDHEQLRNRLNALVTTGDESGSGPLLDQKLKELKHRCQYHKNGLLPQARLQKEQLEADIAEHQALTQEQQKLSERVHDLELRIAELNNHKTALRYNNYIKDDAQVRQAQEELDQTAAELAVLERQCSKLPSREEACQQVHKLSALQQNLDAIQMEEQMMPDTGSVPEPPAGFEGCTAKSALLQAEAHRDELRMLRPKKSILTPLLVGFGTALLLYAAFLFFWGKIYWSMGVAIAGLVYIGLSFVTIGIHKRKVSRFRTRQINLFRRYGNSDPDQWVADAHAYAKAWEEYSLNEDNYNRLRGDLDSRRQSVVQQSMAASDSMGLGSSLRYWNDVIKQWDACADARRLLGQKEKHLQRLEAMASSAEPPEQEDHLTFTEDETNRLLSDANHELKQLLARVGQYRGQVDALGSKTAMEQRLQKLDQRIAELEQTLLALEYARKALQDATDQLQRRFAPRIAKSTQELFTRLTGGRYDRLRIAQDLSLEIGARGEDVLRSHRWRSEGTVDQLYLALRLAVARELTPDSPIILDDALVRFDDGRLKSALSLLEQEGENRQVIIFTCQKREKKLLEQIH